MEIIKKRPRSANWDEKEKLTLLNIVMNRLMVIEDKNKTISSNKRKEEAWQEIQHYMNQFGYKRDAYRLREQWLRMKAQAKKAIKSYHKEVRDNEPSSVPPPTDVDYMIRDIVPEEFMDDVEVPDKSDQVTLIDRTHAETTSRASASGDENSSIPNNDELSNENPCGAAVHCEIIDVESYKEKPKVQSASTANPGESTDTADGSDGVSPRRNCIPREEVNLNSGSSTRPRKSRSSVRQMTGFEAATLELKKMKTEAAMRHEVELHRVKMEAALWERRFWEAKLLRVQGYRI